jgi:hypothetical protein
MRTASTIASHDHSAPLDPSTVTSAIVVAIAMATIITTSSRND